MDGTFQLRRRRNSRLPQTINWPISKVPPNKSLYFGSCPAKNVCSPLIFKVKHEFLAERQLI
jgi:hypothetical protein